MTVYRIRADDEALAKLVGARVQDLDVAARAARAFADSTATAVPVDVFDAPPYETPNWLVPHYLAAGHLITLIGEEGLGKGLLSIYWSRLLLEAGHRVLWMSTEDDLNEVKGRLGWAGWKTQSGCLFHVEERMTIEALQRYVTDNKISLVIMDAGRDFMSHASSHNDDATVRPSMLELRRLARETGAAILFIHHTNKATVSASGKALSSRQRMGGAAAFMQVPRHNLMLERSKRQEIGLAVIKSNISSAGHISVCELEKVKPFGRRFNILEELEDPHITLDMWRDTASEDGEEEVPNHVVDDMVINTLRSMPKIPSARKLYDAKMQPLILLKAREIDGCYTRLEASGQIVREGRSWRWG